MGEQQPLGKSPIEGNPSPEMTYLPRLRREELVASLSKTHFFVRSVGVCGHVLENGSHRLAPRKMLALERWTKPDNAPELRGFWGSPTIIWGMSKAPRP